MSPCHLKSLEHFWHWKYVGSELFSLCLFPFLLPQLCLFRSLDVNFAWHCSQVKGAAMTVGMLACRAVRLLACLWASSLHKCFSIFSTMPAWYHFCLVHCNTTWTEHSKIPCLSLLLSFHLSFTLWIGLDFSSCPTRICLGNLCSGILAMCPNHHMRFV